jgi:hypothetical protein
MAAMKCKLAYFVLSFITHGYLEPVTAVIPCSRLKDSTNYTAIENVLLTNENIVELEKAFFPTNRHSSVVVNVNYHLYRDVNETQAKVDHMMDNHHQPNDNVAGNCPPMSSINITTKVEIFCVRFRWFSSPINLLTRPELLKRLALMTYQASPVAVDLLLKAPCTLEEFVKADYPQCEALYKLVNQLNALTSNVSSSVADCLKKSNSMLHEDIMWSQC